MSATAAASLRELHRIHRQLTDLRDRLDRGPKKIRAREANVANLETQLATAKDAATAARMTSDRKQLELKASETKISDLQAKLNTCSSNKEYQALLDQIAAAEMANSVLADEILEAMERIDELEATTSEAENNLAAGRKELERVSSEVTGAAEGIKQDVARLDADLKQSEATLPDDIRDQYFRVVRAKGEDALAMVEDGVCSGCHQQITPNQMNEINMSRAAACKSCGRVLYLPE